MIRRLLAIRGCTAGTAAVEFAIVGAVFIALVIGILDFGRTFYVKNQISALADQAARKMLIDPNISEATLQSELKDDFFAGNADDLTVTVTTETASGTSYRVVTVVYPMTLLIPGLASNAISLNVMRRVPTG